MSFLNSLSVSAQTQYCLAPENQDIVARISGLRIDLLLSGFSRHLHLLGLQQPGSHVITASRIEEAESARSEFLQSLSSLGKRFKSVKALEIRLDEADHSRRSRHESRIKSFIRKKLPGLESLYLSCDTQDALSIMDKMSKRQCFQLRRLLIHSKSQWGVTWDFTERFQSLSELELSLCFQGPPKLHPLNQGLTRLRLANIWTSEEHLIRLIKQCPAPYANHTDGGSPLVELVLTSVSLDSIKDESTTYEMGTWSKVSKTTRECCPKLTFLRVDSVTYDGRVHVFAPQQVLIGEMERERADNAGLKSLVECVRSRRGGVASGLVSSLDGSITHEF